MRSALKRLISWIVLLTIVFTILPAEVSAATNVVASGKLGDKLSWKIYSNGLLKVTGKGATYDFGSYPHGDIPFWNYGEQVTSLELPEGLTIVGDYAFNGLSNVTGTLKLPSTVTEIKYCGFCKCGFSKVVLPNSITNLGYLAFGYNNNLTQINIPNKLKTFDTTVFDGCHKLQTITANTSCKNFTVIDNVLFDKNKTTLVYYPPKKAEEIYSVPKSVKEVRNLTSNDYLKEIILPEGLGTIGKSAFAWNVNLEKINIPSTVTTIGEYAFYNCHSLKELDIPKKCATIGEDAFLFTTVLERVIIRNSKCNIKRTGAWKSVVFYGAAGSTAQKYATRYGYEYRDSVSGKLLVAKKGNQDFINLLPTKGLEAEPPLQAALISSSKTDTGEFLGYQFYITNDFQEAEKSIKQEIQNKVDELCANEKTDYEKAYAICNFVFHHMTYVPHAATLTSAWKYGEGNCETYAILTATMLYYAGIPHAYAYIPGHVYNLAFCDGRWVPIDSQGLFDLPADRYEDMEQVILATGGHVYVIDDFTGIKFAQVGLDYFEPDKTFIKKGIDVPDWITGYYTNWSDKYPSVVIRGKKGSQAERMAKEMGYKIIDQKGCFVAVRSLDKPKVTYKGGKKKITISYKKVPYAKGIQIHYRKYGTRKWKKKSVTIANASKIKIKKLKKGTYQLRARSYAQTTGKKLYSEWTTVKKVKVK